jgi:NAD(P)-dependent dehydrogenase (short-subunit alcohol dehydrogenase family)
MTRERRFEGRTLLVTGSTGMAASTARAASAEGAHVVVVSRTAEHARALADAITEEGGRAEWRTADLTAEDGVERAVEACVALTGRIDALYNVAGISGRRFGDGLAHQASLEGWETVMRGNATSTFLVCRAVLRQMLGQEADQSEQRGAILNMSSTLARHPSPEHFGTHAYAASKGAIEALTRSLASAYAPHGIRVNAIAPGLVATPMSRRAQDDRDIVAYLARKQPLAGGPIEAGAVTPVALHLLSSEAAMVTGQVVDVDAGWGVSEG